MKAPDKIYASIERTYEASNGQVIGMVDTHSERKSEQDIAYIRKDALLEWIDKEYGKLRNQYEQTGGPYYEGMMDAIDHMESFIEKLKSM